METYQQRKELFDLVHSIGEVLENKLHIVDTTEEYPVYEDDQEYRIYHADGYCFDVERIRNYELEDGETHDDYWEPEFEYNFFEDYEGFKIPSIQEAIQMIKNRKKIIELQRKKREIQKSVSFVDPKHPSHYATNVKFWKIVEKIQEIQDNEFKTYII